jgi:CHAT domain-containing protein
MVILSACNTCGKAEKAGSGEGFSGLTRSFMYAGTKSILVTHWMVDSKASRDLMVETFKEMKEVDRDKALRIAKLKMKKSSRSVGESELSLSHPFFWAPFVLVGERE